MAGSFETNLLIWCKPQKSESDWESLRIDVRQMSNFLEQRGDFEMRELSIQHTNTRI